jgi:8-oxo-dGTP diphosphatase
MKYTIVGANIVDQDGEILMVQEGKEEVRGHWNLPSGRIEPDEDPIDCARREAREETGLVVRPESLVGIYADQSAAAAGSDILVFVFESVATGGDIAIENDSVIDWTWAGTDQRADLPLREDYISAAISDYFRGSRAPLELLHDLRDQV